jgi:molybdopterin converting factor subunit 1
MEERPTIRVLFFASLSDVAGGRERQVPLRVGMTVGELRAGIAAEMAAKSPASLASSSPAADGFRSCRIAVNRAFAADSLALSAGDEVAFIPPVSGG